MAKAQTLEQSFEKLEQIIGNLENGDVSLEDSFKLYNEGMKLIQNGGKKDCGTQSKRG